MKRGLKITLIVITILVTVVNVPIIGGFFLPKSHVVTKTIHLPYDPENVWLFIMQPENFPNWRASVKKVDVVSTNPDGLTSWREYYKYCKPTMFQITEAVPYSSISLKTADLAAPFVGKWIIRTDEIEEGTLLTITEDTYIYNPIYRSVAHIRGRDTDINEFLADIKEGMKHQ